MCKHEQAQLVGTADGIRCRGCGKVFNSFAELERDREPPDPQPEKKTRRKKSDD